MKNKYIAPETNVRFVKIESFILSTSTSNYRKTMMITKDDPITSADEILTKERSFFDEDDSFRLVEW